MNEYNDNLHKKAGNNLYGYAKDMRINATDAEELLWQNLRGRKVAGLKFRRQHPIDKFIADFYCHEKNLVIELDGGIHDSKEQKEVDKVRTYELNELNITVLRFKNEEVLFDIHNVIKRIIEVCKDYNNNNSTEKYNR